MLNTLLKTSVFGAFLFLGSCSSTQHNIGLELMPDFQAELTILGSTPEVQVMNHGPGVVVASICQDGDSEAVEYSLEVGSDIELTAPGPLIARMWTNELEGSMVSVHINGSSGISIDQEQR